MDYLLLVIATVLLALDFALSKKYQTREGTDVAAGLKFNALIGLFTALIFFALSGFRLEFSWFSILLAAAMTLCSMAYSIVGFRVLKAGGMALYSLFLMLGGMLLPYLFGVLFLEEALTVWRILGVLLIAVAVVCSAKAKYRVDGWVYFCCLAVFILNGIVSILSKCHQIDTRHSPVSSTVFVMYSGIAKCALSSFVLLFCKKGHKPMAFSSKKTVVLILCSALIGGLSYMLQLVGARELPATVLYPIVTGGSIIFSALSGKVFFKERLSVYQLVSIVLCFAGTLLFL